jgi:predicted PurR-regulated permease PerM
VTSIPRDFKAEAFRLGLVLCLISVPFGGVIALVAPMASDSGDVDNPALIAFVFAAMIYPLVRWCAASSRWSSDGV